MDIRIIQPTNIYHLLRSIALHMVIYLRYIKSLELTI